jgi:hypothetical protein
MNVGTQRAQLREEWQEQVTNVRAWHTEALATVQAAHLEEISRIKREHLGALHSMQEGGEAALRQVTASHAREARDCL